MSQKYWKHKYLVVLILGFSTFQTAFTQSLILRPSIGVRYYSTQPSKESSNNFDPSFSGYHKFKDRAATISLELLYKKYSYEFAFTSQHLPTALYTNYKDVLSFQTYGAAGISQFQLQYNRFFEINKGNRQFIKPFVGIGVGIGFNRPSWVYKQDTFYTVFRQYAFMDSTKYLDMDMRTNRSANNSFSLLLKAGFSIKRKNIERLRITAIYNGGLNKVIQTNIVYYHTNAKFSGTSFSRGSQFSILLSMPIYLKRKQ